MSKPLQYEITPLVSADAAASRLLEAEVLQQTYGGLLAESERMRLSEGLVSMVGFSARRTELAQMADSPNCFALAARNREVGLIGQIEGAREPLAGRAVINGLYVSGRAQGRGIGKVLLTRFLEWTGPDIPVDLVVVEANRPAVSLYRRFGFEDTANDFMHNGTRWNTLRRNPGNEGGEHEV